MFKRMIDTENRTRDDLLVDDRAPQIEHIYSMYVCVLPKYYIECVCL